MMPALQFIDESPRSLTVGLPDGRSLWRYNFVPDTPIEESPRPYMHPVRSLRGDVLTNFRPNDHPWHHGLSFTLGSIDALNFWGGPSYQPGAGYAWMENHGVQVHRGWTTRLPGLLEQTLDWINYRTGEVILREARMLETSVADAGDVWSLRWRTVLRNATSRDIFLGNFHATAGLAGSHYTGLQFRGARGLLDDHGDVEIRIVAEGGLMDEAGVHGAYATWMAWHGRLDGTLHRICIRFTNASGPIPWFVRRGLPLAAFAFHRESPVILPQGASRSFDHLLTFADQ